MKKPKIKKIKDDTGFSASDFITSDNTVKLVGKAEAKSKVIVYEDGTKIGSAKADKNGKWTFKTDGLADGAYDFKVKAKKNGDSKTSKDVAVSVDTAAATPTTKLAAASDSGKSSSDHITHDTTPTLTGTAEAGATVEILDGASSLGTAVADSSGAWTFTTAALASGAHSFTGTATDTAGNVGATSAPLSVIIDTATPAAPSKPDLGSTSDTGASATDNVTRLKTPTLTGTAEANATVTIRDGATVLGTATANGSGDWKFTTANLGDGVHSFTATATDTAGNVSAASSALSVTIDTAVSAPSTPDLGSKYDTGASNTDNITSVKTPTLTGTAEANATVTIRDGATVLGTATANGSGDWKFTTANLGDGVHSFTATATDTAGNVSAASSALAVTIDTAVSAPSTPDLDAASDTGVSATDNITSDTTPTLTGSAETGAAVEIFDGASSLGTATADGGGAWSFTTGLLLAGAHSFTAKATDLAGNVSAASSGLAVTIDTTAPATPSTPDLSVASDTGTSVTDNLTSDTTPTLTGTATAGTIVAIRDGGSILGSTVANGLGTWTYTTGVLAGGAHSFTASGGDVAGNSSAESSALAVTIDTASPTAPSTPDLAIASDSGASSTDNLTSDTTPTLTGTAEAGATVELFDGASSLGTTVASGGGAWSLTTGVLTEGSHSLTATATDAAGNTGPASSPLLVTIDTMTAAPSTPDLAAASDSGISDTDNITSDGTPTLTGTAEAGATVTIFIGLSSLGTTVANGSGDWSFTPIVAFFDGTYSLTAKATDEAGNTSAASGALALTIDTIRPAPPSTPDLDAASDLGSSATDNLTADTTPTLTGTSEAGATVEIFDGASSLGTTVADGGGAWSFTTGTLGAGVHSFTAKQTDLAGHTSFASGALSVTIDTTPPAVPSTPDLDPASDTGASNTDNVTDDTTPTFNGTADPGTTIEVFERTPLSGAISLGTTITDGGGHWSFTSGGLPADVYFFSATATDPAGNTSAASSELAVAIGVVPPAPSASYFDSDFGA